MMVEDLQYQLDRIKERLYNIEEKMEAVRRHLDKVFRINSSHSGKYVLEEREDGSTTV